MVDTNKIGAAGEFVIETAVIVTAAGKDVDVVEEIIDITIYEDTLNAVLSGSIIFRDNFNLLNVMPLVGQELLKLKIKTPSFKDPEEQIDFTEQVFFLHNIEQSQQIQETDQYHIVNFISMEAMHNQRRNVSKTLRGTYSDIVENIVRGDLKSTKKLFIEPSSGIKQILASDDHPMDFIETARREAVSKEIGSPSYLFFETMNGFHFRSLESLYALTPSGFYTTDHGKGLSTLPHGQPNILAQFSKIKGYSLDSGVDTLWNSASGVYGSRMIVHDIFNKTYTTHSYNYLDSFKDGGEHSINELQGYGAGAPLFNSSPVDDDENRISDFPSKQYLLPVSIKDPAKRNDAHHISGKGTYPYTAYNPESWLMRQTSKDQQLESGVGLTMEVVGHTALHAGDIVTVDLPYISSGKSGDGEVKDKFFRGAFFVRHLQHRFSNVTRVHSIYMYCVKDCLDEHQPIGGKTPVPVTKRNDTVCIEEYGI